MDLAPAEAAPVIPARELAPPGAFERIMGLLLAAVAVEFIAGGIRDMLHPP